MERKKFIQKSCGVCLLGMAALLSPGLVFNSSAKNKAYKAVCNLNNEVIIPLSLFADTNLQIVSVKGWDYDMAVHQKEDKTFAVFLLKCTHMDNAIRLSADGFTCSMHGSTYNKEGEVTKGPAEKPLEQYKANILEENLIITP